LRRLGGALVVWLGLDGDIVPPSYTKKSAAAEKAENKLYDGSWQICLVVVLRGIVNHLLSATKRPRGFPRGL
jgi:hypothetical protein